MDRTHYYIIEPPPHSICKRADDCDPSYHKDYLENASKKDDGWYETASSGGIFMFCVKDGEIIHHYRYAVCSGELYSEYHKEGELKNWKSISDLVK